MNKVQYAIQELSLLLVDTKTTLALNDDKVWFIHNLNHQGYGLSFEDTLKLFNTDVSKKSLTDILYSVCEIKGSNYNHSILLPTSGDISFLVSWYNRLTGGGLVPDVAKKEFEDSQVKVELLKGITFDIDSELLKLFHSQVPLKLSQEKMVAELYQSNDGIINKVNHTNIVLKEVLARHIKWGYDNNIDTVFARSAIDVLRAVSLIAGCEDAKLDTMFKIPSLPNKIRRKVISDINTVGKIEDVVKYKSLFKRLFAKLHLNDKKYSALNDNIVKIAYSLYNENNPDTINTVLHNLVVSKFTNDNIVYNMKLLSNHPSFFIRNFDAILRNNLEFYANIIFQFSLIRGANTKLLLQLLGLYLNRDKDVNIRSFNLGGLKGTKVVDNKPIVALDAKYRIPVIETILALIKVEYKLNNRTLDNVYIDPGLFKINLPFGLSASDLSKSISAGSRLDIELPNILRLFLHWRGHIDMDLSVSYYDENNKLLSSVSFSDLRNPYTKHSGDVRSAPNGASEFIDIDLTNIDKNVRYIVPYVNSWSGESAKDVQELFMGYMSRGNDSGKLYEPKSVDTKFSLVGDIRSFKPFYIDLVTKEFVWTDSKDKSGCMRHVDYTNNINQKIDAVLSKKQVSIGQLLQLHANNTITLDECARLESLGEHVNKFDLDFAFDVATINSVYL